MAVRVPKGIIKLPWSLTEYSTGVSLSDGVANTETEVVEFQVPRNMSVAVKAGARFAFYARDTADAELFDGIVRIVLADANKTSKFKVYEAPIGAVGGGASGGKAAGMVEWADREKMARVPAGFSRGSDEFLLITYEDKEGKVLDDTEIALLLEGVQFVKI
ncbi:MAG: hypothetical protein HWN68_17275 [Desulfobacterales bacterium]|nr:hypothetical protein [Desulfobacterales bacterium]